MKKTEIYVPIANKKEAKRARIVLESLGEKISSSFFDNGDIDIGNNALICCDKENEWIVFESERRKEEITLKQLIELLVKQSDGEPKCDAIHYAESNAKPLEKIAVKVENEKEFNALMKYYDSLGWNSRLGNSPLSFCINQNDGMVSFEQGFCFPSISSENLEDIKSWEYLNPNNYQIIPFTDFAKDKVIKVPLIVSEDGVELFEGDEFWHVCVGDNSSSLGHYNPIELNGLVGTPKAENGKFFSTKQAALDWIESQKPKTIDLPFGEVSKSVIRFYVNPTQLDKSRLELILKTMNEL